MSDRSRYRAGRAIHYHPTAAEVSASGADPWLGMIAEVNIDGTYDLWVNPPNGASIGAALSAVATPDAANQGGGYVEADVDTIATLANALKTAHNAAVTRVNELRTAMLATRKASCIEGAGGGQFTLAPVFE